MGAEGTLEMTSHDARRTVLPAAFLALVGVVCLGWFTYHSYRAEAFRDRHVAALEASARPPDVLPVLARPEDGLGPDGVVGVLEIPRLGVSEVVAYGDGDETLDVAIGHLPDTPLPWVGGNSVVAAHRDTHFRPLRDVRTGDLIRLRTKLGVFEYLVKDRLIVDPDDVWVMAPSKAPRLTLVTCYPFDYVGSAPQRFIVQADAR